MSLHYYYYIMTIYYLCICLLLNYCFIPQTALALGVLAALYALIALFRPRRLRTFVSHLGPKLFFCFIVFFSGPRRLQTFASHLAPVVFLKKFFTENLSAIANSHIELTKNSHINGYKNSCNKKANKLNMKQIYNNKTQKPQI